MLKVAWIYYQLTIQRATRLVVQTYHKLSMFPKTDFIETLHDRGSIHKLRYIRDMIFAAADVYIIYQRLVILLTE